ncbi:MAG: enoyl-CoA hydratase/isomerase family protein [Deltaproteobacteria bacterium]|nr:enoyl-CoA hydratase/isomerase family protein [Candidatus Zymogenaceae bacterium]
MSSQIVIRENRGPVSWVIFNRPEVYNAFNLDLAREAFSALCRSIEDPQTRVVVLTGAGKAFSVGADVLDVGASDDPPRIIGELATIAHRAITEVRQSPKPVIAAINRLAAGYGMALALASDIRIATERLRLRYAYSTIGLTGDGGINWSLPRLAGTSRALEVALLAEDIHEKEAERLGIITKFVPEDQLVEQAQAIAERIAALPPKTASAIKRMIYGSADSDLLVHLAAEHAALTDAASTPEFSELLKILIDQFSPKT